MVADQFSGFSGLNRDVHTPIEKQTVNRFSQISNTENLIKYRKFHYHTNSYCCSRQSDIIKFAVNRRLTTHNPKPNPSSVSYGKASRYLFYRVQTHLCNQLCCNNSFQCINKRVKKTKIQDSDYR